MTDIPYNEDELTLEELAEYLTLEELMEEVEKRKKKRKAAEDHWLAELDLDDSICRTVDRMRRLAEQDIGL